jgi:hypothetical protein
VAVERLAVPVECGRSVRASAAEEVQAGPTLAIDRVARTACPAATAKREREDNVITDFDVVNAVSDLLDYAGSFVAEDAGERKGDQALPRAEVRVAETCGNDPD